MYSDGVVKFFDPKEVTISMRGVKLVNHKKAANRIFGGGYKTVCAWISCDEVSVDIAREDIVGIDMLLYNPRLTPNWVYNAINVDGHEYDKLVTSGRNIFIINLLD
jgi:hypothetical protein